MCVYSYKYTHVHVEARDVFLHHSLPYVLRQALLQDLELTMTRLATSQFTLASVSIFQVLGLEAATPTQLYRVVHIFILCGSALSSKPSL